MSDVEFERLFVLNEAGKELQLFRATLGGQETFGRSRAQCLEQLAWQLRRLNRLGMVQSDEAGTLLDRQGPRDMAATAARSDGSGESE